MTTQYRRSIIHIRSYVTVKEQPAWCGKSTKEYLQFEVELSCGDKLIKNKCELRRGAKTMNCQWCQERETNAKYGWITEEQNENQLHE
jgi:hypothetical protein